MLSQNPLKIRIRTTDEHQLIVENSLQRKTLRVESNGVGLSNISTKYRLLGQSTPRIEEKDGWFQVTLPLLMPQSISETTL
ncbi:hypothetical protein [Spirosoma telluris]|uniref:hypothetical protein n=1 Tax=Spirosoma telluris TaxID=2183553 RepID=UPI002FC27882